MPDRVFIQRTRFGRTIFVLRDHELEITAGEPGQQQIRTIPLTTISSEYEAREQRFNAAVIVLYVSAAAGAVLAIHLGAKGDPFRFFAVSAALMAGVFALAGARLIPRMEYFEFSDQWRRPLFAVVRERGQIAECEAFVHDLLNRMERAGAPAEVQGAEPPAAVADEIDSEPEWRWQAALVIGLVGLTATAAANYVPDVGIVAFVLLSFGSACAAVLTWQSFTEKERHRHWSLLGVVFLLVAFVVA